MTRKHDTGDGDPCPLRPEHGNMFVLVGTGGNPPMQYCSHVWHDGHGGVPRTRAVWPLYGLEDTVATYVALAERESRQVGLPPIEFED